MGDIPWLVLISILHQWVQYLGCGWDRPLGSRNGTSGIGPQLFNRSALVWYVRCLYSFNWTLLVRIHGWHWHQSSIDGSNIWGVDRTDPWGPAMRRPPLGSSYLVVMPSLDMSGALIFLIGLYGWDSMAGIDINPSSMGPIFRGCGKDRPLGSRNWPSAIGLQLFGSSSVVW